MSFSPSVLAVNPVNPQASERVPEVAVNYLGPLITNTTQPGERKSDGVIPAHPGGGALQVAQDRWMIFFATLNHQGSDCNRSILYQLRQDSPDGALLSEGVVDTGIENWDPLDRGDRFVKSCGMPIAFGVPQGATLEGQDQGQSQGQGQVMPHANVFVVKWYRWAHLRQDGCLYNPAHHAQQWPEGPSIKNQTMRVEWMQFRLNEARDDIERLTEPTVLRQRGYESGDSFCELGPGMQMNHAMKSPVPEDASCRTWVSVDTFTPYLPAHYAHGSVAAVRFAFNEKRGLYEWVDVGRTIAIPDRLVGEASVNRVQNRYLIALRCFEYDNRGSDTCWFSTEDLFGDWGTPTFTPSSPVPRIAFVCGDGVMRLFSNSRKKNRAIDDRSILSCWDVDPQALQLSKQRTMLDAGTMVWPFNDPFVDMAKLCPPIGRRQLLLFRVIDRAHTQANVELSPSANSAAFSLAGIHAAELLYDKPVASQWTFANQNADA